MNKEFVELMLRAPAVPEWFDPEVSAPTEDLEGHREGPNHTIDFKGKAFRAKSPERASQLLWAYQSERERQKVFQWPSYYARKTLEAAAADERFQPQTGHEHPPIRGETRQFYWNGDRWIYSHTVSRPSHCGTVDTGAYQNITRREPFP